MDASKARMLIADYKMKIADYDRTRERLVEQEKPLAVLVTRAKQSGDEAKANRLARQHESVSQAIEKASNTILELEASIKKLQQQANG
jgi:hypothetical protein